MNEVFRLPAFAWCFLFGFTKQLNPNDKDCSRGDLMVCCTCKHMNPHKKDMCEMLNLLFLPLAIFRLFYMDILFWDPYLLAIGSSIWTPNTPSTHLCSHSVQELLLSSITGAKLITPWICFCIWNRKPKFWLCLGCCEQCWLHKRDLMLKTEENQSWCFGAHCTEV